jgi:hypothetical protein
VLRKRDARIRGYYAEGTGTSSGGGLRGAGWGRASIVALIALMIVALIALMIAPGSLILQPNL